MDEKTLVEQILYHDKKYIEGNPEISDMEYERLKQELKSINPDHELLHKIEDIKNPKRKKIKHSTPMLSLDKVYTFEDLLKWMKKVSRNDDEIFLLEPKYDGMAARYENNILVKRGDGIIGEDISEKIPLIKVWKSIKEKSKFYTIEELKDEIITGELVILNKEFKDNKDIFINKKGESYKIPRSAISGIINEDGCNDIYKNLITFINYDYESYEISLKDFNKEVYQEYINYVLYINKCIVTIDGIVIKLKDKEYSLSLGSTSHHPKGQIALKLGNPCGETILKEIELSIGKKEFTPVGIVEPVEIEGIMNSKISLHNYQYIIDKDVAIGDNIIIERCGEIIPQLKEVILRSDDRVEIKIPKICPYCNGELKYESPHLYCVNEDCDGMLVSKLYDSVIRLGIERLGKPTIKKMIQNGYRDIISILKMTKEDILKLDGFKDKSAINLFDNIRKVRNDEVEDWRILSSLNIEGIGKRLSKIILSKFTINELFDCNIEMLNSINGMSDKRSKLLLKELERNRYLIIEMFDILLVKNSKNLLRDKKMKKICFTGKADKKRDELISEAEQIGYEFTKTVGKNLDLLVTNDSNSNSNKMKKAIKFGVQVITYQDFEEMVNP